MSWMPNTNMKEAHGLKQELTPAAVSLGVTLGAQLVMWGVGKKWNVSWLPKLSLQQNALLTFLSWEGFACASQTWARKNEKKDDELKAKYRNTAVIASFFFAAVAVAQGWGKVRNFLPEMLRAPLSTDMAKFAAIMAVVDGAVLWLVFREKDALPPAKVPFSGTEDQVKAMDGDALNGLEAEHTFTAEQQGWIDAQRAALAQPPAKTPFAGTEADIKAMDKAALDKLEADHNLTDDQKAVADAQRAELAKPPAKTAYAGTQIEITVMDEAALNKLAEEHTFTAEQQGWVDARKAELQTPDNEN